MKNLVTEAAIDNPKIASLMVKAGITRLEVCGDLSQDGLTPSVELWNFCKSLGVPCFAMIRPTANPSFVADSETLEVMLAQVARFKSLQADGLVLGVLTKNKTIDIVATKKLVEAAQPLPVTFHKAIDITVNLLQSTHEVLNTGVSRILSSGGKLTAEEGLDVLKQMRLIIKQHNSKLGDKVNLVVAGKVTYENLSQIVEKLPDCEYHGKNILKTL